VIHTHMTEQAKIEDKMVRQAGRCRTRPAVLPSAFQTLTQWSACVWVCNAKAEEMEEAAAVAKAAAAAAVESSPAVDEPGLAAVADAADAAARIEQEMREPISEEMEEEQKKKKASAGL
jgi:hypothetical protein